MSSTTKKTGSSKASPVEVERYIKGVHFPSDKNALIKQAESNKAPSDVLNVLKSLEDKKYSSPIDIAKSLGKLKE